MRIKRISSINQRASFFLRSARAQCRQQQTGPPRTRRPKNFRQRSARQPSGQQINFRNAAGNCDHLLAAAIIERCSHAPRQSEFHLRAQRSKVGSHSPVNCQRAKASLLSSLFVRLEEFSPTPPSLSITRPLVVDPSGFRLGQTNSRRSNVPGNFAFVAAIPPLRNWTWTLF
jgi:hypothetical protein